MWRELEGDSSSERCRVLFHWVTPLFSSHDRRERAHLPASPPESLRYALEIISRRVASRRTSSNKWRTFIRHRRRRRFGTRRGGPVSATGHKFARAPVVARKTDLRRRQEASLLLPRRNHSAYPRLRAPPGKTYASSPARFLHSIISLCTGAWRRAVIIESLSDWQAVTLNATFPSLSRFRTASAN